MTDTILKFISELEELEKKASRGPIMVVSEGIISMRIEVYERHRDIRETLPKLLSAMRILVEACEFYMDDGHGKAACKALARVEEILK